MAPDMFCDLYDGFNKVMLGTDVLEKNSGFSPSWGEGESEFYSVEKTTTPGKRSDCSCAESKPLLQFVVGHGEAKECTCA